MSRRTRHCLACVGRTRHDNQVCTRCRRRGVRHDGDQLIVPLQFRLALVPKVADPNTPTLAELREAKDLTGYLTGDMATWMRGWHGTDCGCTACVADRLPGRQA